MNHCAKCGAPLPPGAEFCPRCGTPLNVAPVAPTVPAAPVVPPPAVVSPAADPAAAARPRTHVTTPPREYVPAPPIGTAPPPHQKTRVWWIIPLTLLVLGGVAWLLLAGLPFGGEDKPVTRPATETIAEGTAPVGNRPVDTATIVDVSGEEPELVPTTSAEMPPNITPAQQTPPAQQPPPMTATQPPPRRTIPVPREPVQAIPVQPAPSRTEPAPAPVRRPVTRDAEISESEAVGTLRSFVSSRNPYGVASDCIGIASRGYRNVGYTLEVVDTCNDSRLLGRWRVDSKTREVFRQRADGRYLRP